MSTQSDMALGETLNPFTAPEAALLPAPLLRLLCYHVHTEVSQIGICQKIHFSILIVCDGNLCLKQSFKRVPSRAVNGPPTVATLHALGHLCGLPKFIMPLAFCTPACCINIKSFILPGSLVN